MPHSETVTIGIPCFNAERWIAQCLESAIAQSPTQLIVVDDGSTDRSPEIIRGFGEQVELLTTPNLGSNAARNAMLERAAGEWIQFLDADDYLLPGKVESQLAIAGDADVVYGRVLVDDVATPLDPDFDLYQRWLSWQLPQTGGALWRTSSLRQIGGWNETIPCCQEHELYLRAIQSGLSFTNSEEALAVYRIWSEETLCRKNPARTIRVRTRLIRSMRDWLKSEKLYQTRHAQTAGRACFGLVRDLAHSDIDAASDLFRSLKSDHLIYPAGDAAPWKYRAMLKTVGFRNAERLAATLRR